MTRAIFNWGFKPVIQKMYIYCSFHGEKCHGEDMEASKQVDKEFR